jgi:hypothetical protein
LQDKIEKEAKFANIFHAKLGGLSTELCKILLDDMITAFQNKSNVLNQASARCHNYTETMVASIDSWYVNDLY